MNTINPISDPEEIRKEAALATSGGFAQPLLSRAEVTVEQTDAVATNGANQSPTISRPEEAIGIQPKYDAPQANSTGVLHTDDRPVYVYHTPVGATLIAVLLIIFGAFTLPLMLAGVDTWSFYGTARQSSLSSVLWPLCSGLALLAGIGLLKNNKIAHGVSVALMAVGALYFGYALVQFLKVFSYLSSFSGLYGNRFGSSMLYTCGMLLVITGTLIISLVYLCKPSVAKAFK